MGFQLRTVGSGLPGPMQEPQATAQGRSSGILTVAESSPGQHCSRAIVRKQLLPRWPEQGAGDREGQSAQAAAAGEARLAEGPPATPAWWASWREVLYDWHPPRHVCPRPPAGEGTLQVVRDLLSWEASRPPPSKAELGGRMGGGPRARTMADVRGKPPLTGLCADQVKRQTTERRGGSRDGALGGGKEQKTR